MPSFGKRACIIPALHDLSNGYLVERGVRRTGGGYAVDSRSGLRSLERPCRLRTFTPLCSGPPTQQQVSSVTLSALGTEARPVLLQGNAHEDDRGHISCRCSVSLLGDMDHSVGQRVWSRSPRRCGDSCRHRRLGLNGATIMI